MTASARIKEYIANLPEGEPFTTSTLRTFASTDNIRQILNRQVKSGEIKRVARGVYLKPKFISSLGEQSPLASDFARVIAESTGEIIAVHGSEAARQLQLSTQVPVRPVFYTNGNSRTLKIANRSIKLQHVNPSKLIAPGTISGLIISALMYLGKDNVTSKTISMIKARVTSEEFLQTTKMVEHMPTWMADLFYKYQREHQDE
jgi:hypothetical protein